MAVSGALMLFAPRDLRWRDEALPPLGADDLLVETIAGAISIGSELPLVRGDARSSQPPAYPRMTGYESLGVIRERGSAVRNLLIGDRVVATYGHRTHAIVAAARAIPVPPDISDELAVLVIISGDVATGIRKLGSAIEGPVLVTGGGAIGQLAVFVLSSLGATEIDLIEPIAARRELARRLGARIAVAPDDLAPLREHYPGGVECSSQDAAFRLLQDRMQTYGRICVLADGNREPLTLSPAFHERQLIVSGSSDCPDYHDHARWWFSTVRQTSAPVARIFDLEVSALDLPATFLNLADDSTIATKVLVRYDRSLNA